MKTLSRQRRLITGLAVCFLLIAIDQAAKWYAVQFLKNGSDIILIPGVFQLHYLENVGVAFGVLKNQQWIPILFAVAIAVIFSAAYWKVSGAKRFLALRVSMLGIIAGAIGNLIDRVWHGYVIDFAYFSLIDFPVFNIADCYIVVSILILAVFILFVYREEELKDIFHS